MSGKGFQPLLSNVLTTCLLMSSIFLSFFQFLTIFFCSTYSISLLHSYFLHQCHPFGFEELLQTPTTRKKKGFFQPWSKLIVRSFRRKFDKSFVHHQELSAHNSLFPNRRQFFVSALYFNAAKAEDNLPISRENATRKPSHFSWALKKLFFNFQRNDLLPKRKV